MYHSNGNGKAQSKIEVNNIPDDIAKLRRWVCWEFRRREGEPKPTKVPVIPWLGEADTKFNLASSTDPSTWGTLGTALDFLQRHSSLGGVGFVLGDASGVHYSGVDLDDSIQEGVLVPDRASIVAEINSYTEVSPSGKGVKTLVKGVKPPGRCKKDGVEIYSTGRFFTVTGNRLDGCPTTVEPRQTELHKVWERIFPEEVTRKATAQARQPIGLADEKVISLATRKWGEKFTHLFEGDLTDVPKKPDGVTPEFNSADQSLCNLLAAVTRSEEQIVRIVAASGLYRAKWDRQDYHERTVRKALEGMDYDERLVLQACEEEIAIPECGHPPKSGNKTTPDTPSLSENSKPTGDPIVDVASRVLGEPMKRDEPARINLLRWAEIKRRMLAKPPDWFVDKIIAAEDLGFITSLPWAGKSTILAKLMADVCQGTDFFDHKTQQVPVAYVNSDQGSYDMVGGRIVASLTLEDGERHLEDWLYMPEFETLPCPLPADYCERVIRQVGARKGILIVDTLRTAFLVGTEKGTENDTAVLNYVAPLRQLARKTGWAIIIVHHNNRTRNEYAGGAILAGQSDFFINVDREERSAVANVFTKTRRGFLEEYKVLRSENGVLSRIDDDATDGKSKVDHDLIAFIELFPDHIDQAKTLKQIMEANAAFFELKQWTERTTKNKLSPAQEAGRFPRLEPHPEDKDKKGVPIRYFRV